MTLPLGQGRASRLDTWLKQTPYSDPGDLDTGVLPRDPAELARLVRGLIIHRGEGEPLGYGIPPERLHHDAESRYVTEILRILRARSNRPLPPAGQAQDEAVPDEPGTPQGLVPREPGRRRSAAPARTARHASPDRPADGTR
ncbi:hypothetical protein ABZZ74_05585 [Streptomyces sp. NPDC006476]|uniref:hypothetical protein n=1 Tax=Streptomyces sp. NPDC006476 TaxID=3157175 RepID=UPI0033A39D73